MASFSKLVSIADIAVLKNTVGGEQLSAELLLLLTLVICDGYLLFPSAAERAIPPLQRHPATGGTVIGAVGATSV